MLFPSCLFPFPDFPPVRGKEKNMRTLARAIDRLNALIGVACAYSVLLVAGVVLVEVFSRRVLGAPTVWSFELFVMLYGFHFMMTVPYGLLVRCHVNVDIVYNRFSPRTRAILDLCTFALFFFPFTGGLLWASIPFALQSWAELETSWSVWSPPVYPIKTVIPIAFFLMILQGVSECIKRWYFIQEERAAS
jgi:TRAP-type mannitol/chloroaromatic compound transport system permease small subunit